MRNPLLLFLLLPILLLAQPPKPLSGWSTLSPAVGEAWGTNAQTSPPTAGAQAVNRGANIEDASQQTQQAIKHLLLSQVEAWNKGNLEGFMEGYWHSPDLTFFSGTAITKGWEPTLARYRQRYQSEGKEMGRLEFQNLNIEVMGPRSAVVTGKWQLTMKDGKQPHGLFTLVLKRMQGAGWRIVHDHTSGE